MNIYSIYKITNLTNNKTYIGWTSRSPFARFKEHQKQYNPKSQERSIISYAIEKYGLSNFTFDVIYQSKDYEHSRLIETDFIQQNNSLVEDLGGWGYNIDKGGLGHKRSKTTIEKHRQKLLGRKQSEEHKFKKGQSVTGNKNGMYGKTGHDHPSYGKTRTEETKKNISEAKLKSIIIRKLNGTYIKPNTTSPESIAKQKATKLKNRAKNCKYKLVSIMEPGGNIINLYNGDYKDYFKINELNNFISKSIKNPGIIIKGYTLTHIEENK
jgi:group I intron endonuclease